MLLITSKKIKSNTSELAKIVTRQKSIEPNNMKNLECYKTKISQDEFGAFSCLYRIEKGFMDESHGIEVAKTAGIFVYTGSD